MQAALKLVAPILPGKRIEVSSPDLPESGDVELIIVLPSAPDESVLESARSESVLDFLASLPKRTYSPEEWNEVEQELQKERNSWER